MSPEHEAGFSKIPQKVETMPVDSYKQRDIPKEFQGLYLVLWDGSCSFCKNSIEWFKRKAPGKFKDSPYQNQAVWLPPEILKECSREFYILTPDGNYLGGGDAFIILLKIAGYGTWSSVLGLPILRQATRVAYKAVASRRGLLSKFLFRVK